MVYTWYRPSMVVKKINQPASFVRSATNFDDPIQLSPTVKLWTASHHTTQARMVVRRIFPDKQTALQINIKHIQKVYFGEH